ncbi:casein kinase II subunit beta [Skeletonema marinoi]|uniref:Casein kinase II subunit beta n=2 Tax=Skeletonema marinoi TaxID=267567 RepID=A0AAD8XS51_9STRA|nr:casein kinase II subunit beta [Skeletonema marinoi]|mmetsp:Transcript_14631/g.30007  ORF Transcript_14631/g.30007 Transcript_14631/m.30007 type:complete len:345 (+) Transcript_14631:232-1266(+)|eukprot:CAMPEP_0113414408 /NCGR_PEP_ID=MMETSP0013_2-20120614/23999_1 /TAXON_ID=2843 ORGANISM="Skeletonema costatum, Strain 1716" /NCGR_SAMPLE_ID=MMETSP0013_2 /ASSEMBLY_ACC=CAM_ASM_000158 /LENGTH=344 /DNA_ID=CAMNT_0000301259 /DNA_START=236 /DNA_END=1270 /DNA_ORIENTATION=- /assembly_acc=CAM_ASM_000158
MAYNEDSSASGHDEPWIQWFCGLKGHEMFCEVERAYIEDGFNLYGLRACVSNFSDCLDLILDRIGPDDSDDSHLTKSACTLYGLIHARYIVTAHGLDSMYNKYAAKEFGTCPLIQCSGQPVLPVGLKDDIGLERVKIFCPKCQSVYHPPPIRSRGVHHSSNGGGGAVDGAAFGTTFPHLFLMTFNNLMPDPLPPDSSYTPKVFGFRVHKSAWQQGRGGYPSRSNNNNNSSRRGGAYTQRRLASMTTSRVAPAAPVQQQPAANAGKDGGAQDGRTGKPSVAVAGTGEASPQPVEAVKPESKETIPGVVVEEASANGNDSASKRKNKSDGSKNSVSPKRQKRSDAV